jgi:hypothetical protein
VEQLAEPVEVILLDQEVCLGASTLAAAGRTSDLRGDTGGEAALAQCFHLGNRAGHRRDEHRDNASRCGSVCGTGGNRVKNLKFLILGFGGLGLAMIFVSDFSAALKEEQTNTFIMLACFGVAAVTGLMSILKPPAQAWEALLALAGFSLAAVKLRVWETLPKFMDHDIKLKLILVAAVGGVVVGALALAKPESHR